MFHQASPKWRGLVVWSVNWQEWHDHVLQWELLRGTWGQTRVPGVPYWTWWIQSAAGWIDRCCRRLLLRCLPLVDHRQPCLCHEVPRTTRGMGRRLPPCTLPTATSSASRLMGTWCLTTDSHLTIFQANWSAGWFLALESPAMGHWDSDTCPLDLSISTFNFICSKHRETIRE